MVPELEALLLVGGCSWYSRFFSPEAEALVVAGYRGVVLLADDDRVGVPPALLASSDMLRWTSQG